MTDSASTPVGSPATFRGPWLCVPPSRAVCLPWRLLSLYLPPAGSPPTADLPSYPDCFGSFVQIHETFDERSTHSLQTWPVWPDVTRLRPSHRRLCSPVPSPRRWLRASTQSSSRFHGAGRRRHAPRESRPAPTRHDRARACERWHGRGGGAARRRISQPASARASAAARSAMAGHARASGLGPRASGPSVAALAASTTLCATPLST